MKRLMMIAVSALLLMGMSAFAQEAQNPPANQGEGQRRGGMMQSPEQRAARLAERLSLTDEQKAKVQKIYEDSAKDMQGMQGASREERMAKMQATNDKVKAVLNDDQKKKFDEMQQQMRQGGGGRPQGGGEGGQKPPSL